MSACAAYSQEAASGVLPALRAVDCLANETTAAAFGRLFGDSGALGPALTILLTLYIAFFALSLLMGRTRLGVAALTPRMLTLGLALTFATSWVAYQGVVWTLAIGAPDQIASAITGSSGSATAIFAERMDLILGAIADVAQGSVGAATEAGTQAAAGSFTPGNLMWIAALMLLLGTVGVLVTARIALAILLSVGPIFILFALFRGTRGLTAGWLRGVVMTAVIPLFVVVGGGMILELLVPAILRLRTIDGAVDGKAAIALFLIAAVHIALMSMAIRVSATIIGAWGVFGLAGDRAPRDTDSAFPHQAGDRPAAIDVRTPYAALSAATGEAMPAPSAAIQSSVVRTMIAQSAAATSSPAAPAQGMRRAQGVGSRFKSQTRQAREIIR